MTVMRHTFHYPDGTPVVGAPVEIFLIAPGGRETTGYIGGVQVVSRWKGTSDENGRIGVNGDGVDLPVVDAPDPAVWTIRCMAPGSHIIPDSFFTVPDEGPAEVNDNLVTAPGSTTWSIVGQGPTGDSAYEIAVANGFEGDEAAWLASLIGPQGIQGDPGTDGADGIMASIVQGDWIDVDPTDPANPVVAVDKDALAEAVATDSALTTRFANWEMPERYGASGAAGTDDTAAVQEAIDAASGRGVDVLLMGRYTVSNLTLPSYVTLFSPGANGYGFEDNSRGGTLIAKSDATGYMVTVEAEAFKCGVVGVQLIGRGTDDVAQSAIFSPSTANNVFVDRCGVYNMPHNGVVIESIASRVADCEIYAGRRPKSGLGAGEFIAGLKIAGPDCYIRENEVSCGDFTLDTSFRRIGIWVATGGANLRSVSNIGEISDLGFLIESAHGSYVGDRADLNYAHGFFAGRVTGDDNCQHNSFLGCWGHRNSRGTTNTYDNFRCDTAGGGLSNGNRFVACRSDNQSADAWTHRYGYYDAGTAVSTGGNVGNQFIACGDVGAGTGPYGASDGNHMQWSSGRTGQIEISGGGTPNVADITMIRLGDAGGAAAAYTDFTGATTGQDLFVWGLNAGGAVLQHSSSLRLKAGANRTLGAFDCLHLKKTESGWQEVGSSQMAAQSDSTAEDVAGVVSDFNSLLAKLRTARLLAPS